MSFIDEFYVDMDGVIFDWEESAFKLFNFKPKPCPKWVPVYEQIGISKTKFWKVINLAGRDFWANLKPYPWSKDLISELSRIGEVYILSSPSLDPTSCSGKLDALQKFFDHNYRDYFLSNRKFKLAQPGRTLIDDKEKHVDSFTKAGGNGILFPRPWNRASDKSDMAFEVVMETVKMLCPGKLN